MSLAHSHRLRLRWRAWTDKLGQGLPHGPLVAQVEPLVAQEQPRVVLQVGPLAWPEQPRVVLQVGQLAQLQVVLQLEELPR